MDHPLWWWPFSMLNTALFFVAVVLLVLVYRRMNLFLTKTEASIMVMREWAHIAKDHTEKAKTTLEEVHKESQAVTNKVETIASSVEAQGVSQAGFEARQEENWKPGDPDRRRSNQE